MRFVLQESQTEISFQEKKKSSRIPFISKTLYLQVIAMKTEQILEMEQCCNNENNEGNSHYTPQWEFPCPQTPDLLGISPLIPNPSIPFSNAYPETSGFFPYSLGGGALGSGISQDSFHSLPQRGGYGFVGPSSGSPLFGEMDEELNYGWFQQSVVGGDYGSNVGFELNNAFLEGLGKSRGDKGAAHFALDKQRRAQFKDKFQALRKLIPNPTKNDRASIVGDAIDYINELRREVTRLEGLIEKKKKRQNKTEGDVRFMGQNRNGNSTKESFWFKKRSNNSTEVDVRVMGDEEEDKEVTVKIVVQKGRDDNKNSHINCLLPVSRVLDELQLGLCHVAGGLIGDCYAFLLNYKAIEGTTTTTLYASAIAKQLIEAMEKSHI